METRRKGETNTESPRDGPPRGQPLRYAARMARAVRGHRGSWSSGKLAPLVCIPTRPACRNVRQGLPNTPAHRKERGENTTSHDQVRLTPGPFAHTQAYGAETQGRTANRRSEGAGKRSSPAFLLSSFPPSAFQVYDRRGGVRGRKWIFVTRKGSPTLSVLMFSSCCCYCC